MIKCLAEGLKAVLPVRHAHLYSRRKCISFNWIPTKYFFSSNKNRVVFDLLKNDRVGIPSYIRLMQKCVLQYFHNWGSCGIEGMIQG